MANSTIKKIISQLALAFTVKDIMIQSSDLVRAKGMDNAKAALKRHSDFDIIPMPFRGKITGYYRRDTDSAFQLTPADLISDGTSLIDLPDLFAKRNFFFVLSSSKIAGFVHFSDLNNSMVKLPLFALFEAFERHQWSLIENELMEEDLLSVLDQKRVEAIKRKRERIKKKDVDLGWSGLLFFSEIIRFAVYYKKSTISNKDREILTGIRNRVAHTDRLLVTEHKDTRKLTRVKELCFGVQV